MFINYTHICIQSIRLCVYLTEWFFPHIEDPQRKKKKEMIKGERAEKNMLRVILFQTDLYFAPSSFISCHVKSQPFLSFSFSLSLPWITPPFFLLVEVLEGGKAFPLSGVVV